MTLRNLGVRVLGVWMVLGLLFPPGIAAGVWAAPAGAPVTELATPLPEESPVLASGPFVEVVPQEMPDPESAPALLVPTVPLTYTSTSARAVPTTPSPAMTIRVTPECVAPGDIVTLTLTVAQPESAARLSAATITATLPVALHWLPQRSAWAYTETSRELQAALPRLEAGNGATYTMQFQADGKPGDTLEVAFALVDATGARTTAKAAVWVSVPAQAEVTERGGSLESADGRVQVAFPEGVVEQTATVVHVPHSQRVVAGQGMAQRFELNLYAADGTTLNLAAPVTVTINVSGLLDLTPSQEQWPYLAYLDEATGAWQRVPVHADAAAGTLTARLEHFSTWETGMQGLLNSGWRLLYNAPQVSTFSGAATFAYPIEVLPGAGGLQPQVALSYNSRRVDGAMSWIQSDWTGLGWSVDTIEIVRQVGLDCGDNGCTTHGYQNKFSLLLNGASYRLSKDLTSGDPAAYGHYYTTDYSGLHIVRCNVFATNLPECTTAATNSTGEYWVVRTASGLTYRLGDTVAAEQEIGNMYWWDGVYFDGGQHAGADYYAGYRRGFVTYRWRVRQVTDVYGHQMDYVYAESQQLHYTDSSNTLQVYHKGYDTASFLAEIRYNYVASGTYDKVVFVRAPRAGDLSVGPVENCSRTMLWQNDYLSAIQVWRNTTLVRQYNLGYDVLRGPSVPDYATPSRLLKSITEYYPGQPAALPPTTFAYAQQLSSDGKHGNKYACWWNSVLGGDCGLPADKNQWTPYHWAMQPWWQSSFPYFRLTQVANGYGGVTQFDYTRDEHGNKETPHSYIVTEARTLDGLGNTARTTYAYANGCWDHDGQPCHGPGAQSKTLAGYNLVTVAQYDYNSTLLGQQQHFFHLDYPRLGRTYRTQTYAPNGLLLTQSDTAWGVQAAYQGTLTYAGQTLQTTYAGGLPTTVRQDYTYDQFGNVTAVYDYGAEMPVLNGSFEAGLEHWSFFGNVNGSVVDPGSNVAQAGTKILRLQGSGTGGIWQDVSGLVPGATYQVRAWVRRAGSTTGRFKLWVHNTNNPAANHFYSDWFAPETAWQQVILVTPYPADASGRIRIHLQYSPESNPGSGFIEVDGVALARVSDVGDERTVHTSYHNLPDTRWLLGLKRRETLSPGLAIHGPINFAQQTFWYYDVHNFNYSAWNSSTHIVTGSVTLLAQGRIVDIGTGGFLTTTFAYDPYGNLTHTWAPGGSHTQVTYDTLWHQYPIQQCQETLCTTTEYYGVNANGAPAGGGLPGQVWRTFPTQSPAQATRYRYDAYGRLQAVQAPDDTGWDKSQTSVYFEYVHLGTPGQQRQVVRTGRNATWQETFFDGLGRTLQVHQRAEGTQEIRTTTQYNALGQAVAQWTPYFGTHPETGPYGVGSYVPPTSTLPRTQTLYNALGQAVQARPPDAAWSSVIYGGRAQAMVTPNGQVRVQYQDARGQLSRVVESLPGWTDNFATTASLANWSPAGAASISNGALVIAGNGSTWTNLSREVDALSDTATGVKFEFTYTPGDIHAGMYLVNGTWGTASYRRWGLSLANGMLRLSQFAGTQSLPETPLFPLQAGGVYRVWLQVAEDGQLTLAVWERDNPAQGRVMVETLPDFWRPSGWRFVAQVQTGTLRLLQYAEQRGYLTDYTYDLRGNLTHVTDALTNTTVITYNLLGQKIEMADPDMGHWTYGYDAAGNLAQQTDARDKQVCFTYDLLNRLTGKFAAPANGNCADGPGTEGYLARYGYNALGQRDVMTDTTGSTAWQYDLRGRLITETKTIATVGTYATRYQYNPLDQVTHITYPGPDGEVVTQTYTIAGQPKTLATSLGGSYVSNATYNALGQPTAVNWGNGLSTQYTYDALNFRLQRLWVGNLLDLRYTYDAVGNVQSLTEIRGSETQVQTFSYDALERLTAASTGSSGGLGQYSETYAYNAIGNLTHKNGQSYLYTGSPYTHTQPHAVRQVVTGTTALTYDYDENGNMIARPFNGQTQTLRYNAENRLQQVIVNGQTTTYFYDGDGTLVRRTGPEGTVVYINALFEKHLTTNSVTKYYYLNGQRIAMRQNGALTYLHGDHLGSASLATTAAGAQLSTQRYLPYGGTRDGAMPTDRQYTGQRHEASLGFYDYNARQYDPVLGRFLQADTMVPERGNSQALNRYAYVANNPLKYVDPSGHCWGFASGVRDLPGYATNCHNFDMALSIVQHPQASTGEKALAAGYLTFQTGAHVALVVGSGVLVWQGGVAVASSVAGTKAAAATGTAATAACADGDCTNEISTLAQVDLPAVQRFAQEAVEINSSKGMESFGSSWNWLSRSMLQMGDQSRMFTARTGERITGMMQVRYTAEAYSINQLEGLGGGAGTELFRYAIQDSLTKGYGGSLYLYPTQQALGFYARFPGYQILQDGAWFWSAEAAQLILGSR